MSVEDRPRAGFALLWQRLAPRLEQAGMAEHRRRAVQGLSGRVLEVGCGAGTTFSHYPPTVDEVRAVEPEPRLRAAAEEAAADAPVPVTVHPGIAEALPADDGWADAAVCIMVLCSVDDPDAAAAELRRVVRPGGGLRLVEHVRAVSRLSAAFQRAVDVVWPHFGGGCHTSRPTVDTVAAGGFRIEQIDRFTFPPRVPTPTWPHVHVTAVVPRSAE